jgi:hypothetical protein
MGSSEYTTAHLRVYDMGILPPAIITIQTAPGLLRKGGDIVRATSSKKCHPNPESHVSRKVSGRASRK